ncbi:MAG: membrane dipeptidase, partial [Pseudomonadales bacterium]|nr:membrane dipeptidase [Pseudomonadales bacterium]
MSNFTKWVLVGLLTSASCSDPEESALPDRSAIAEAQTLRAATEAEIKARARAIHERVLVLDAHADIEIPDNLSRYAGPDGMSRVAPLKLHAGGVNAVVVAAAVGPGPRDEAGFAEARRQAEAEVEAIHAQVADVTTNTVLATSADAIVKAHANGTTAMILGFQNARILGLEPQGVDEFYASGVRVFALTHMGHNDFADSSRPVYIGETSSYEPDAEHGGLSALGVAAIKRVNDLGAIVDVS